MPELVIVFEGAFKDELLEVVVGFHVGGLMDQDASPPPDAMILIGGSPLGRGSVNRSVFFVPPGLDVIRVNGPS